uniref:Vip2Ac-like protein 1 n=1 Tax=Bacillus thuringiensis TaxID=1428 RepID=A0A1Q1NKN1_BACTU|nr:Vip2Ac-like protein 1 [Bacillus thuringiensis]
MKAKNVLVGALSCLCVGTAFSTYQPTKAWATMSGMDTPLVSPMFASDLFKPDFAHDKIGAEKWAMEYYKKWTNSLSSTHIKSIEELKSPAKPGEYDINRELKATGGDINRRPIDQEGQTKEQEKTDRYKKDIDTIDKALSNKEGKTTNKMYVYKDMKLSDLNTIKDNDLIDSMHPNRIDAEKFKDFKNNFNYGLSSDYLIVNLSEREGGDNGILKWRIELPAGTNTGHLDEDRLVLQRNTGLEINNVTIINQKGKEYIRINAKLVAKGKIDVKVKTAEADLNKSWNEILNLPEGTEFIRFEVNDRYASSVTEGAQFMLHELANNVPNNIIKNVVEYMVEKKGGFIFTDNGLGNLPESYYPEDPTKPLLDYHNDSKGIYNSENGILILNGILKSINGDAGMSSGPLKHEFGHALDNFAAKHIGSNANISDDPKFTNIYFKEFHQLTPYAKSNEQEFFAEAFRMMFSTDPKEREQVETKAPETFKFISNQINQIDIKDFKNDRTGAKAWGEYYYTDWLNGLDVESEETGLPLSDSIKSYTKQEYRPINDYLRSNEGILDEENGDLGLIDFIKDLDEALRRAPQTPEGIKMYRRVNETAFGLPVGSLRLPAETRLNEETTKLFSETFTNTTRTEYAFMSTSLVQDVAPTFNDYPILIQLSIPKGANGGYIAPLSQNPDEMEFLLARGYSYSIDNISIIETQGKETLNVSATLIIDNK